MTERHSNFSDEVLAVERRAVASSIAGGAARSALRAGDKMPMFVLPDTDGKETGARELLAHGPLIVLFLRGAWCSYSIRNGKAVEGLRSEIGRRSASVVGVSQQNAQHGRKMKRQNDLGFPLLVDSGGGVAAQFGVKWTVPGCLRESYERVGIDLARYQGEGWTLPIPSMFVAGSDGAIAFAEVDPDFTRLLDVASVLPVLDRLRIQAVGGQSGNGWFQEAVWAKKPHRDGEVR
jgi:peroxiredoxin